MKEHDWELLRTDPRPLHTRFEWRCKGCVAETFTNGPTCVGSHAAPAYTPGWRALRASWIPKDCEQALVVGVHDL